RCLFPWDQSGSGLRPLSSPPIRDRVAQTAAKLVLEPLFEADAEQHGYRPGRDALTAVSLSPQCLARVRSLVRIPKPGGSNAAPERAELLVARPGPPAETKPAVRSQARPQRLSNFATPVSALGPLRAGGPRLPREYMFARKKRCLQKPAVV